MGGSKQNMNSGLFVMSYAGFFFGLFICFEHIRELNEKMVNVEGVRKIKLKKMGFLFLQVDKNSTNIFYLRVVILQLVGYVLGTFAVAGLILSFYISPTISAIIFYSLFFLMGLLAGFAQITKKKK